MPGEFVDFGKNWDKKTQMVERRCTHIPINESGRWRNGAREAKK